MTVFKKEKEKFTFFIRFQMFIEFNLIFNDNTSKV